MRQALRRRCIRVAWTRRPSRESGTLRRLTRTIGAGEHRAGIACAVGMDVGEPVGQGRATVGPDRPAPVLAAVDIGSNSIKMSVARPRPGGGLEELASASETVRLGAGLERTGRLADDRVEAALAALTRFAAQARARGAQRLLGVATEATRVAANGPAFLARAERDTGWTLRVISGAEEAALTFRGLAASTDVSGRVVIADIGGGSTELIVAEDGRVCSARSFPLGSGRLTDRLLPADPPSAADLSALLREATAEVAAAGDVPIGPETRLITVGGTGEYLARLVGTERPLEVESIDDVLARLGRTPAAAIAAELGIAEARARVLPAGVTIVRALVERLAPGRVEAARSGIRAGVLLAAFDELAVDAGH